MVAGPAGGAVVIGDVVAGFGTWSPAAWIGFVAGFALWWQYRRPARPRRLVPVSSMAEAVPVLATLPAEHPARDVIVEAELHWCRGHDGLVEVGDMRWDEGRWLCRSCVGAGVAAA